MSPIPASDGRAGRPIPRALLLSLALAALGPAPTQAQAREWITETTVTWGRGKFAYQGVGSDAVALADLGLRWSLSPLWTWGLSVTGGYDFPSEASLVGGRARVARALGRTHVEGSLAILASTLEDGSLGGILGVALYPKPWGALVLQLDVVPTRARESGAWMYVYDEFGQVIGQDRLESPIERALTASLGLRLARRPALYSWAGATVFGLLAIAFAGELGCC